MPYGGLKNVNFYTQLKINYFIFSYKSILAISRTVSCKIISALGCSSQCRMASSDRRGSHIELYSDIESEFSDSQSMINNGDSSRKSSDSAWGLDTGEAGLTDAFYEVPLPHTPAPEVFMPVSSTKLPPVGRYISQVYISNNISHRSKRHIRDSRELETIPQVNRNLLEVNFTEMSHFQIVCLGAQIEVVKRSYRK